MNTINLNQTCYLNENSIITFRIYGGGGNRRQVCIMDERPISDYTSDLFSPCDEEGNEIEGEYTDECGNGVGLTTAEARTGIGRIDIDGDYDTYYAIRVKDVDIYGDEGEAIRNDRSNSFVTEQLVLWLCQGESESAIDAILGELDYEREEEEEDNE